MLWTAFLLGFLGSIHCLGMCAPIQFAWQQRQSKPSIFLNKLTYNTGRITTYALLGGVAGIIGGSFSLGILQGGLSLFAGFLMLLVGVFAVNLDTWLLKYKPVQQLYARIASLTGKYLQKDGSSYIVGILNGFLPCGLVYFALLGAVATGDFTLSILYMAAFGLGTFPLMLGAAVVGQLINLKWRNAMTKAFPILFICLGLFVMYQGAEASYRHYNGNTTEAPNCH